MIFALFQALFAAQPVAQLEQAALANNVTQAQFTSFLAYAAVFYANLGNYRSFGDTKLVPVRSTRYHLSEPSNQDTRMMMSA